MLYLFNFQISFKSSSDAQKIIERTIKEYHLKRQQELASKLASERETVMPSPVPGVKFYYRFADGKIFMKFDEVGDSL